MNARLFTIPASHPSWAARLMLERKGISYKRVDLIAVMSKGILRAARFPGTTVPALILDGRRIQGTAAIAHELDRVVPEPPLYPPTRRPVSRSWTPSGGATRSCSRSRGGSSGTC
jgi:glutathione S-transferase